jgi:thiol-disulfide isomerase/thioredoxin
VLVKPTIILFFTLVAYSLCYGQHIIWITDLSAARKLSKETGKPLLYDFTASWCGPCRNMDKNFWPKREVVELSKRFICVKVDFDRNKSLAAKYGVSGIPNVVFTDPWGRGIVNQLGFASATEGEILSKFEFIPTDFTPVLEAGNVLESDGKNLDALHKMWAFYQERKLYWQGTDFLESLMRLEPDPAKRENVIVNLAYNYIRIGEPDEAIDKFEILQKEFPRSPQNDLFLYGLMYASIKKNKLQNAERYMSELKSKFPASKLVLQAEQNLVELRKTK